MESAHQAVEAGKPKIFKTGKQARAKRPADDECHLLENSFFVGRG